MKVWWLAVLIGFSAIAAADDDKVQTDLYTVVDGTKVDAETLKGFKTWRAPRAIAAMAQTRKAGGSLAGAKLEDACLRTTSRNRDGRPLGERACPHSRRVTW
jgi:hypothetical protein